MSTVTEEIWIEEELPTQLDRVATSMNMSHDQVMEIALTALIQEYQVRPTYYRTVCKQGDNTASVEYNAKSI